MDNKSTGGNSTYPKGGVLYSKDSFMVNGSLVFKIMPIAIWILENGTDIRYIQELLGHSSSRTTEIYTHVSTRNIQNIVSPFDML